jgi:hypothetical protein
MNRRDLIGRVAFGLFAVAGLAAWAHNISERSAERDQLQAMLDRSRETYRTGFECPPRGTPDCFESGQRRLST